MSKDSLTQFPATEDMLSGMRSEHILTTLWFSTVLVEEVSKTDSNNMAQ